MATSADKRIAKWDAKFNTERVKATLDDLRPDMLAAVNSVFPLLATMEAEVKQVLDGEGISVILYPFYLNFGRELWRLQRNNLSGESLAVEAQTLIQKWVARGLGQTVLEKIRTDVFTIPAPTP
jgi:hypothetical protein